MVFQPLFAIQFIDIAHKMLKICKICCKLNDYPEYLERLTRTILLWDWPFRSGLTKFWTIKRNEQLSSYPVHDYPQKDCNCFPACKTQHFLSNFTQVGAILIEHLCTHDLSWMRLGVKIRQARLWIEIELGVRKSCVQCWNSQLFLINYVLSAARRRRIGKGDPTHRNSFA